MSNQVSPEQEFLLQKIGFCPHLLTTAELYDALEIIRTAESLSKSEKTTLCDLFELGPLGDGYICSSSKRGLIQKGLASPIISKGREGYTALNYRGGRAYKLLKD